MKAMVLSRLGDLRKDRGPLDLTDLAKPVARGREILLRVLACGVCHTELDEIEGRTPPPRLPVVLGHQVVGVVERVGGKVTKYKPGDRAGVGWIYWACGKCRFCREGRENLCADFLATGRDADGGYAEFMKIDESYAFPVPRVFSDSEAAPLLCAGAIGYRSLRLAGITNGEPLGLTGFGASAHLVLKMARHRYPDTEVYVFARNPREREFATELGAAWAGDTEERSPRKLRSIIDTRLVINAIRKEDADKDYLLKLDYADHLWCEKEIKSVANVARVDIREFLELAAAIPIKPEVKEYALEDANDALLELKGGKVRGAKVLRL
jgi:propanol-preferring alcohol dehydrogenase